ncbi:MAG: radical SAM protein [Candidatus Omnitrophica bacterium]|nr:radical SAM protein [Candidatus Omnitrophota bacterium]MDD5236992.1 radical SAM protein [Candidatus Omnitrophota bacterium]
MPSFIQIEPTNICNLSCSLCPCGNGQLTRPKGNMPFHTFKSFLDKNHGNLAFIVFYNMGEPFLNEEIFKMINYAVSKKIFVKISTNGLFKDKDTVKKIVDSGLDELLISLDFIDRESYKLFKGKDNFDEVKSNVSMLLKERGSALKPFISLQLLLVRENQDKIPAFIDLCRRLEVDRAVVKKARVGDYCKKSDPGFLPTDKKYIRDFYLNDKRKVDSGCLRPWVSATILWDGAVVPCCLDMDGKYKLGDIRYSTLDKIWNGPLSLDFRRAMLGKKNTAPICRECSIKSYFGNFIKVN